MGRGRWGWGRKKPHRGHRVGSVVPFHVCRSSTELGGGSLGNTAGSTPSGAGAERGTPEALPKDEAVNCYLSNQAVSRLPGVRQWLWKVSQCQSEEWHRQGPSLLGNFCCESHGKLRAAPGLLAWGAVAKPSPAQGWQRDQQKQESTGKNPYGVEPNVQQKK